MPASSMITLDFGSGNKRRFINVTNISRELERKQTGLSEALISFHALTGCDYNSAFYRKGKSVPFSYLEKDPDYVEALKSLCTNAVDKPAVTAFVCRIYGFKALDDINEARHQSFTRMTKRKQQAVHVKKINCSSLPPCEKYVSTRITGKLRCYDVSHAHTKQPTKDLHPLNYGWIANDDGLYVPHWYEGEALPDTLSSEDSEPVHECEEMTLALDAVVDPRDNYAENMRKYDMDVADVDDDSELDDQPWSDDSESECEDED
ncbi:hypothetical protein BSL78_02523 [Apostichopus japonicus]|uniref:Uncharacterized protein n=1 Tax=Stichopus japonicus TaxID=307972 RepID=A0A2G8LK00_STIJA|nr:hypothetical protein BSL78_02523 [Apostichopus japonicus]